MGERIGVSRDLLEGNTFTLTGTVIGWISWSHTNGALLHHQIH